MSRADVSRAEVSRAEVSRAEVDETESWQHREERGERDRQTDVM